MRASHKNAASVIALEVGLALHGAIVLAHSAVQSYTDPSLIPSGSEYACIPLRILPPQPLSADAAADPKGKGVKPGGKGPDIAPATTVPLINRGALKVRLGVKANVALRDWMRRG